MKDNGALTNLIKQFIISGDHSLFDKIGEFLNQYSINDVWLPTLTNSETKAIITYNVNGKEYIPLFSDVHQIQEKGNAVVITSINKIIEPLLRNPRLGGIIINPLSDNLCINTGTLLQKLIGERKIYEEEKFDWGKGIPNYSQSDILDKQSLLNFGIEIFDRYCYEMGIMDMFCSNDLDACPNALIKKDGKLAFVLVNVAIAPEMPTLNIEDKNLLLKRAKQFGFDCYYVPVGIGSADSERFDISLALRGDEFYVNLKGLEEVIDIPNIPVKESAMN